MLFSEMRFLKIKTRVKYGVTSFDLNLVKLREITDYGKSSISSLIFYYHLTTFSF